MKTKTSIRFFNDIPVRAMWDNDEKKWLYSASDVINDITESNNSRRYWNTIKSRHIELSTVCRQLKLTASDGKKYLSDVIDSVLSSANVETYIDIIKDKYVRRKLIETCNKIQKQAVNEGTEQAELIDTAEKEIFLVAKQRKSGEFKSIDQVVKSAKIQLAEMAKNGKDITGIIEIPKLKLVSGLSMILGQNASPIVPRFKAIGYPVGVRGNSEVLRITFLSDVIDSDIQ